MQEQITWAVEGGADFIVGETFGLLSEALLAAECIKRYGNGMCGTVAMTMTTVICHTKYTHLSACYLRACMCLL